MPERRQFERRALTFEATLMVDGDATMHPGFGRDLSLGGLYLVTHAHASTGQTGRVMTTLPGTSELITLPVIVRWAGHDGMGLQFGPMGEHERRAVSSALRFALPKRSIPPGGGRKKTLMLAAGLTAGFLFALAAGFVAVRFGPNLVAWVQERKAEPAAGVPTGSPTGSEPSLPPMDTPAPRVATTPSSSPPAPAGSASAPRAAPPPPASSPAVVSGDASACMARFFPEGSFAKPQDLGFVCTEADPREAAKRMKVRVVLGSNGKLTPGMQEWSRMGWYELAVLAVLRKACCADAAPMQLPPGLPTCGAFGPILEQVAIAVTSRRNVEASVKAFEDAAACVHAARTGVYRYPSGPLSGSQVAFASFLQRNLR